jgi:ribosomal protein S18 acetylase RimI-like enzyme
MHNIRNAGVQDIDLIRQLCLKVWPQTYSSIISQEQIDYMLEMMYSETSLKKQMEDGAQFIIVYDEEAPVGFASFGEARPAIFKLHKLYVLPSQQGKGTGRFMLGHILSEIKKENAQSLQLQVNRRNNAKLFYEKNGFTIIKEFDFDIGNGYMMDDYVMEKKL